MQAPVTKLKPLKVGDFVKTTSGRILLVLRFDRTNIEGRVFLSKSGRYQKDKGWIWNADRAKVVRLSKRGKLYQKCLLRRMNERLGE